MSRRVLGALKNRSGRGLGGFWRCLGGAWSPGWPSGGTQIRFSMILGCLWGFILGAYGVIFFIFSLLFCKWLRIRVFLSFWEASGSKNQWFLVGQMLIFHSKNKGFYIKTWFLETWLLEWLRDCSGIGFGRVLKSSRRRVWDGNLLSRSIFIDLASQMSSRRICQGLPLGGGGALPPSPPSG